MSDADIAAAEAIRAEERAAQRGSMQAAVERWPNLVTMFLNQAARLGDRPFLWKRVDGAWAATSWAQAAVTVARFAEALTALGVRPGDRVALVAENRPEFCLADLGIMAAGAVTVPTYTTNTERDHLHILENAGAVAVVVSTAKLARILLPAVYRSSRCRTVIGLEPLRVGQSGDTAIHDWAALLGGQAGDVDALQARAETIRRQDLACLIYTSGTGGSPRGVQQHHGAILHNVAGCVEVVEQDFPATGTEVFLSFLPLSHAYEHTAGQFFPIGMGAEIYYADGIDKLSANIEEVRPTIMVVVPRLFEVLRARMLKSITAQGGLAPRLLGQAERIGRATDARGRPRLRDLPMTLLLERTLKKRVRDRFGGRLKAMVSGGAPLNPEVATFFASVGLIILQGYGQTESAPIISCNRPAARIKPNTVGPPLNATEVRIAADGEIEVRGELVMHGYWRNDAETARVLHDGWLGTGDIGHIDDDGHIVITDRKKDIIVLDKGDNVAPARVEGMLTLQPEIAQAMVSGDRRPHLVGVVVPDPEWAADWSRANPGAGRGGAEFVKAVGAAVGRVNAQLSQTERVRRVMIADEAFTIENEQLTPSMKIRRHVLKQVYGARLDALYG